MPASGCVAPKSTQRTCASPPLAPSHINTHPTVTHRKTHDLLRRKASRSSNAPLFSLVSATLRLKPGRGYICSLALTINLLQYSELVRFNINRLQLSCCTSTQGHRSGHMVVINDLSEMIIKDARSRRCGIAHHVPLALNVEPTSRGRQAYSTLTVLPILFFTLLHLRLKLGSCMFWCPSISRPTLQYSSVACASKTPYSFH